MTRVITISSGKGGVGKTFIAVNLAVEAVRRGLKVCLFDADLGLANVDILLKLKPRQTLVDVIEGRCRLSDILLHTESGLDVIPGSSGVDVMANLPPQRLQMLQAQFATLQQYDLILFDTSSGIGRGVMSIIMASPEVYLVITPEPTSLTDAYGMIKLLYRDGFEGQLNVVVNNARTRALADHTFERFREVARVYLQRSLPLQGVIPFDSRVSEAIREQRPFIINYPDSPAARKVIELADRALAGGQDVSPGIDQFWKRYLQQLPDNCDQDTTPAEAATGVYPQTDLIQQLMEKLESLAGEVRSLNARVASLPDKQAVQTETPEYHYRGRRGETSRGVISIDRAPRVARNLRQGRRPTPIDGLQLRRIMGRLLLKAQDHQARPISIDTETRSLARNNPLHLIPGRYTVITLVLEEVQHPHQFVCDVLETCDIEGCDVRELGSNQHLWLAGDCDGCIKLDTAEGGARLEICVTSTQSAPEQGGSAEYPDRPVSSHAKLVRTPHRARGLCQQLKEKYSGQLVLEADLGDEEMEIYRLKRFGKPPLFCGVMQSDSGQMREDGDVRLPYRP